MKKQCTCTPTDLQPFGECICGAEGSREIFDNPTVSDIKQEKQLYETSVPYPEPKNLVEQLANYQYIADQLMYKMGCLIEKIEREDKETDCYACKNKGSKAMHTCKNFR